MVKCMAQESAPRAIDYIANIRLPTEKAHGIQIAKTCEAFVRAGSDLQLIVPTRENPITEDPFTYYGISPRFPLVRVPVPDTMSWGVWGFRWQSIRFAFSGLAHLRKGSVVYGRDEMVLWIVSLFCTNPIVWESHTGSWNYFARSVAKRARGIVAISQGLKDFYAVHGIPSERIVVAHDGVDLSPFTQAETREVARRRLGLPHGKNVVLYIGRVDGWKDVETLLAAAALLPADTEVVVIGGE